MPTLLAPLYRRLLCDVIWNQILARSIYEVRTNPQKNVGKCGYSLWRMPAAGGEETLVLESFLGPADLSASLGVPGQTGHDRVFEAAARTIRVAKAHGKQTAAGVAPQDIPFWVGQGVDLLFCINDIAARKTGAQAALGQARAAIEAAAAAI